MSERSIHDDYRSEITTRFAASRIYNQLRALCASDPAGNEIMAVVNDAAYYAYQRTKIVVIAMREYTLHDGDHLFRVLN